MKVYVIRRSLDPYIRRIARNGQEEVAMTALAGKELRFRYKDLIDYGLSDMEIQEMLGNGFLREKEVDHGTAISIGLHHKINRDKEYEEKIMAALGKAREIGVPIEEKRAYAALARKAYMAPIQRRRRRLMKEVLIPEFGVPGADGELALPKSGISIKDVEEALAWYPRVESMYPGNVYTALLCDMRHLGIKTSDVSVRLKRMWRRKVDNDPKLLATLRKRIEHATEMRKELYERDPSIAEGAYRASAATRREKMQTDQAFRRQVMGNLALGHGALWKKYRTDKKFREKVRKKQLASLAKGLRTIKSRAARRRNKLRRIIEREFGSVYDTTLGDVVSYLQTEKPDFLALYYRSESAIKKDLHALRNE